MLDHDLRLIRERNAAHMKHNPLTPHEYAKDVADLLDYVDELLAELDKCDNEY